MTEPVRLACPKCKSPDFLETTERLLGGCPGEVLLDDDGKREMVFGGYTKVDWDSSTSVALLCVNGECDWYAEVTPENDLDDVLTLLVEPAP